MDYNEFISKKRAYLEAPPGYGKTYSIVTCLELLSGKSLILTHTNAGVASIKEKIKERNINPNKYYLCTIDGFLSKYVHSFYKLDMGSDGEYWALVRNNADKLFKKTIVNDIISLSYSNVLIDEYQDCSKIQHSIIMEAFKNLNCYIFGDPLQNIFDFDDSIDLTSALPQDFYDNKYTLATPWRWSNTNPALGAELKQIRQILSSSNNIDISNYTHVQYKAAGDHLETTRYLISLASEKSVLVLHHQKNQCVDLCGRLSNIYSLIEAIDEDDFFSYAKKFDSLTGFALIQEVLSFCEKILVGFTRSGFSNFFSDTLLEDLKAPNLRAKYLLPLKDLIEEVANNNPCKVGELILGIKNIQKPQTRIYPKRQELFYAFIKATKLAETEKTSIEEAIRKVRNITRYTGRRVKGRIIGRIRLTKGLEFDTVVVLAGEEFKRKEDFYVAITRASKNLIIYSSKQTLQFNTTSQGNQPTAN